MYAMLNRRTLAVCPVKIEFGGKSSDAKADAGFARSPFPDAPNISV